MDDLISRQAAIDALCRSGLEKERNGQLVVAMCEAKQWAIDTIEQLPSAESESFEWCDGCKEYDQEAHCCHRWSKMIRKTVEEMKLVYCIDCQHSEYDSVYGERWCHYNGRAEVVDDYHFCRDGERREDGRLDQQGKGD